ncbi:MAG: hypothetical protein ABI373_02030, partial [Flavobacteriales bacterium]
MAQTYKAEAHFDSLDTRHDMSRPLLERFWITSNHTWACFNRGLKDEGMAAAKEELELAEQIGVDTLLSLSNLNIGDNFSGSADAALQL